VPLQPVLIDPERKLKRMTILVGMVGSDGIILAADQCRMRPAQNEAEFDDRMLGRKITHVAKHKVAYAVAGDDLTDKVAHGLIEALDGGTLELSEYMEQSLEKVIDQKIAELQKDRKTWEEIYKQFTERTLLVVFYGMQEPQLWRLRVQAPSSAKRVDGMTIAGALGNSARFFNYYFQSHVPIRRLLPLASHAVLMGCRIDSLMIEGLDIATFDATGYHFFDENQKAPLRERSAKLDALIRKRLFAERK
jgi:hypothetical protein